MLALQQVGRDLKRATVSPSLFANPLHLCLVVAVKGIGNAFGRQQIRVDALLVAAETCQSPFKLRRVKPDGLVPTARAMNAWLLAIIKSPMRRMFFIGLRFVEFHSVKRQSMVPRHFTGIAHSFGGV